MKSFLIILVQYILNFLKNERMVNHRISKEFGISFWYTFSGWFFQKIVTHIILYQLMKLQCQTFLSFSRYWRKSLLKFLLRQLMTSWTLRFIFDQPLSSSQQEKKGVKANMCLVWYVSYVSYMSWLWHVPIA